MARLSLAAIVALTLATTSAFAQDRPAFAQIDPAGAEARPGVRAFEEGRFEDAVQALGELAREHPDDPIVLRYLGLAYLRLDRPAEAAAVLARAKGDSAALYALGVAKARLGHVEEARAVFRRVIEEAPSSADAERARAYLDNLADAGEAAPPAASAPLARARAAALTLRAGLQYDDNVPPLAPGDPRPRASPRAIVSAEGYEDLWTDGGWRLRAEGTGTAARALDAALRRFDLVDLEAALDAGYSTELAGIGARPGLRYGLQPTFEGGRLANIGHLVTTSLALSPADSWVTSLAHLAQISPFVDQSVDVGGRETGGLLQSLRLLQYYLPTGGDHQLYGGYSYEWNDARDPNASYSGSRVTLGGALGLSHGLRLDARLEAYSHDYPRFEPVPRRQSQGWLMEAFLSLELDQNYTVSAGYQRAMEDSNIPAARYRRNLFTVLLGRSF